MPNMDNTTSRNKTNKNTKTVNTQIAENLINFYKQLKCSITQSQSYSHQNICST